MHSFDGSGGGKVQGCHAVRVLSDDVKKENAKVAGELWVSQERNHKGPWVAWDQQGSVSENLAQRSDGSAAMWLRHVSGLTVHCIQNVDIGRSLPEPSVD